MTPTRDQVLALAIEAGATHARGVDPAGLHVEEHVRASCAMNGCGKYDTSWGGPPAVGELPALEARLQGYTAAVLVQNIATLEDSWDFEGMEAAAEHHNALVRALADAVAALGAEALALGVGCCHLCGDACTYPDAPCRLPAAMLPSVEGYGLDIKHLVESHGLNYINGVNTVSYVGMVLWR